jgi:peroxiredoxin family protein
MKKIKKLSIVCFSGDFDKAFAVFTLASGAAAVNYEVNLFFTFWGFNLIKKQPGHAFLGKNFLAKIFNFLMGGRRNLPLSRLNFGGLSPYLMTGMMRKQNIATLGELMQATIALKVNFFACETSMLTLGLEMNDFIPQIKEVIGVAKFLEYAEDGEILFI